jgi:hypothetical protein
MLAMSGAPVASAQDAMDPDAASILAKMSSHLGGLQAFAADYDVDINTISEEGQKLLFSSSGEITIQRPDKLYATRQGAFADVEIVLDGKNISILGKQLKGYIQFPATTIDEAVDAIRDNTGLDAPGADLLGAKPLDLDVTDVVSGAHVGMAYVDGVETHHLAFRGKNVDWQLWVQADGEPLPLKYVITSKWVYGAPEYTLRLSGWDTEPRIGSELFTFAPPADAKVLDFVDIDDTGQFINEAE